MSTLAKAFESIRKFRNDIEAEIDSLESQRETLMREREEVRHLPIPREDAIRRMEALIDHWQEPYEERVRLALLSLSDPGRLYDSPNVVINPLSISGDEDIRGGVLRNQAPFVGERLYMEGAKIHSLMGLLGPTVIKQRLREIMESMPYPDQVGLPMAERSARLQELDDQIRGLSAKIAALVNEAREAGIDF